MLRLVQTLKIGRLARTKPTSMEPSSASLLPRFYSTPPTLSPFDAHLRAALKVSLKARDSFRTGVIKVGAAQLQSSVSPPPRPDAHSLRPHQSLISDLQHGAHLASPPAAAKVLRKAIATRLSAADQFLAATPAREDLATQYRAEAAVLEEFTSLIETKPEGVDGMGKEELSRLLEVVLVELRLDPEAAVGGKDMGRVVKALLTRSEGKAGGKAVSDVVKSWRS